MKDSTITTIDTSNLEDSIINEDSEASNVIKLIIEQLESVNEAAAMKSMMQIQIKSQSSARTENTSYDDNAMLSIHVAELRNEFVAHHYDINDNIQNVDLVSFFSV